MLNSMIFLFFTIISLFNKNWEILFPGNLNHWNLKKKFFFFLFPHYINVVGQNNEEIKNIMIYSCAK